jgi:tetratricopeptide (TPR) repeat protein
MDEAVKKHTAGDIAGAIPLYEQALSINPEYAHGWTNLASAYQASGNFTKALEAYNKAYNLDNKGEADNLYFIGLLDENAGQGSKAIQDYSHYITGVPHGTYVNDAKSRMMALKAHPTQTQKILTANEQTKLNEGGSSYDQAVKLQQENKLDEALEQYKKAIASQPNEASYYYGIGTCYAAKNDLPEAIKNYQKAISLNPQEPSFKQALKQTNQAQAAPLIESAIKKQTTADSAGKYDLNGAIADYEAALKLDDDANTHLNLGTAYQANINLPRATAEYKRALQMNASLADAHYYLGTIYDANSQKLLAVSEYQKYLRMAPNGSSAADTRARLKALGH